MTSYSPTTPPLNHRFTIAAPIPPSTTVHHCHLRLFTISEHHRRHTPPPSSPTPKSITLFPIHRSPPLFTSALNHCSATLSRCHCYHCSLLGHYYSTPPPRLTDMASTSKAGRKRSRTARVVPAQPQPERPARVIQYSEDAVRPDPVAVPPPQADLPPEMEHTFLKFDLSSLEHTVLQRFTGLRFHRARVFDWELMGTMGVRQRLEGLISPRWRKLIDERRAYHRELALEFHAIFKLHHTRLAEPAAVSFALGLRTHILSIAQFGVLAGLYTLEETTQPIFTESLLGWTNAGLQQCVTKTQLTAFWSTIGDGMWSSGIPASQIRDPMIRFLHRIIAKAEYLRAICQT